MTAFRDQVTILGLTMKVWGEYEKLDGVKNDKENGRERRKRRQLCELNNRSMRSGSPAYFTSCSYEIVQWCNIPISELMHPLLKQLWASKDYRSNRSKLKSSRGKAA